jgi:hypothetical protein
MYKAKRKKIYYIPGIISLVLVPLLFIHFADKVIKAKSLTVIRVFLADTDLFKKYPEGFKGYKGTYPPKRNYTEIFFTGNEKSNKIKLDFAQIKIREILSANDSTSGVHFHFTDKSPFGTFIKSLDILNIEDAHTYMTLDKDLWVYYFPPDTTYVPWICGTVYNDIVYEEPEISWWTKTKNWISAIWKSSWQIILSFAGFLFGVLMLKRQNRDVSSTSPPPPTAPPANLYKP